MTPEQIERLDGLWGCADLDVLFKGASQVIVPWPSAGRRKGEARIAPADVGPLVSGPARLHEVDPRVLFASQPWVLRTHAVYYSSGEWEMTGRTSADMHSLANRYPTFIERGGQLVIAMGHHRSLVALIEGRPVLARIASSDLQPVAITPHLWIGGSGAPSGYGPCGDIDGLVTRLQQGQRISVDEVSSAAEILRRIGLDESEIDDRLRSARLDSAGWGHPLVSAVESKGLHRPG